jgi:hypothetical protein
LGSASFPGTKKSWVLGASILRVAGENMGGILGQNLCLLLRGAPQVSPEYGIYDFLAGAAAVIL